MGEASALGADPRLVWLRRQLAHARAQGVAFDAAWETAAAAVTTGLAERDRWLYGGALRATRETWRSAYEQRPTGPLDRALAELRSA